MATKRNAVAGIERATGQHNGEVGDTGEGTFNPANGTPASGTSGASDIDGSNPASAGQPPRSARAKKPQATITVETPEVEATPKRRRRRKSADTGAADHGAAADFIMSMVETFTVARFGEGGRFNDIEKYTIHDPLARLIEKYASVTDRYAGLIDPLLIVGGTLMYSYRISELVAKEGGTNVAQEKKGQVRPAQANQEHAIPPFPQEPLQGSEDPQSAGSGVFRSPLAGFTGSNHAQPPDAGIASYDPNDAMRGD